MKTKELKELKEFKLHVVARCIGGWNQLPLFTGTNEECIAYMDANPCLGYGNDNTRIYPADDWVVDYLL